MWLKDGGFFCSNCSSRTDNSLQKGDVQKLNFMNLKLFDWIFRWYCTLQKSFKIQKLFRHKNVADDCFDNGLGRRGELETCIREKFADFQLPDQTTEVFKLVSN
jgi:hypothetical protein